MQEQFYFVLALGMRIELNLPQSQCGVQPLHLTQHYKKYGVLLRQRELQPYLLRGVYVLSTFSIASSRICTTYLSSPILVRILQQMVLRLTL
jgi:hypothetical protein